MPDSNHITRAIVTLLISTFYYYLGHEYMSCSIAMQIHNQIPVSHRKNLVFSHHQHQPDQRCECQQP